VLNFYKVNFYDFSRKLGKRNIRKMKKKRSRRSDGLEIADSYVKKVINEEDELELLSSASEGDYDSTDERVQDEEEQEKQHRVHNPRVDNDPKFEKFFEGAVVHYCVSLTLRMVSFANGGYYFTNNCF